MIIMICMITLSVPASWVFEKIGWYKTVSIAGIVLMIFTLLRGFIGGSSYTALVITTIGIAVTQPFIINAFGMISALWFPPSERGIANGWGMISTYESAYPVSEGITESLMQLGANGWGLVCLLAVNGIFRGNHMGTMAFFIVGTVVALILTFMIKEASLKERRIES